MPTADPIQQLYQELADYHEAHGPPHVRDRFLILAADAALSAGQEDEADRLRQRLLGVNPHHLLRPFASFAEALGSPDVRNYVNDLRRSYPPEVAEELRREIRAEHAPAEGAVPPTMPVMDVSPPREPKPVVVYWDNPEPKPTVPLPFSPPPRPPRATKRPAPGQPAPPARAAPPAGKLARLAAARRQAHPLPAEPVPPLPGLPPADAEEDEATTGRWVASVLLGLTVALGAGLAVYVICRPFLSISGLP
jgi:hypothetical protein